MKYVGVLNVHRLDAYGSGLLFRTHVLHVCVYMCCGLDCGSTLVCRFLCNVFCFAMQLQWLPSRRAERGALARSFPSAVQKRPGCRKIRSLPRLSFGAARQRKMASRYLGGGAFLPARCSRPATSFLDLRSHLWLVATSWLSCGDAKSLAAVSLQDKCQTLVFFSAFVRRTEVTRELVLTEIEMETVDSIKNTKCPTAMGRVTVACSHAGEKAACIPQRFCFGFQCYDQRH